MLKIEVRQLPAVDVRLLKLNGAVVAAGPGEEGIATGATKEEPVVFKASITRARGLAGNRVLEALPIPVAVLGAALALAGLDTLAWSRIMVEEVA